MDKNISRRTFVKRTATATAAAVITPHIGFTLPVTRFDPKGLPTRKLGKTGVEVPLIIFGCGSRFMAVEDDDKALEILEYAFNNGMYYWDTAASYQNDRITSEERIGTLLKHKRKEVFLATKVGERDAEGAKRTIETSLERLQTDYIDLYQVHSITSVEEVDQLGKKDSVLEVLFKFKEEGVIKHIGFTGHTSAEAMKKAAMNYDFGTMLIAMNHMQEGEKFEENAIPAAVDKGLGVLAMKVIRPRETVENLDPAKLIRYALSLDHVSAASVGIDSMEVLKTNIELIKDFKPLTEPEMEEMRIALVPFYRHENLAWMQPGYVDGQFA